MKFRLELEDSWYLDLSCRRWWAESIPANPAGRTWATGRT